MGSTEQGGGEFELVAVTELKDGDVIDLMGDPHADPGHGPGAHMDTCMWQYETAFVLGEDGPGKLESPTRYRLDFVHMGGANAQDFPPEHKVKRVGHVEHQPWEPPKAGGVHSGQWRLAGLVESPGDITLHGADGHSRRQPFQHQATDYERKLREGPWQ